METFAVRARRLLGLGRNGKLRTATRSLKKLSRVALARFRRRRTRATVIGVTGSSAKTTTAELLAYILAAEGSVHKQTKGNTFTPLAQALSVLPREMDYAVMEVAAGKSSMAKMASLIKPDIAIVTLVADEHRSVFRGAEAVAAEKQHLVQSLPPEGLAMLNADDARVMAMAAASAARVVTFGRGDHAGYRVTDIHAAFPQRLTMHLIWPGGVLDLRTRFVAEHFWLPVAAAVATAIELGLDPERIGERVAGFEPLFNRCGVLEVPHGPTFLIDTAKAPLHSLGLAFAALDRAEAPHKRVVLGHISDYASKASSAYRRAYRDAQAVAQETIFVGEHAHRAAPSDDDRNSGRFQEMHSVRKAADHIKATQRPDELILIKGSSNLHLERIALAITRDVRCWEDVCGYTRNCVSCGKFGVPFERHGEIRAAEKRSRQWWRRVFSRPSA
ncbi:MAG: Mur ligase family protein [Mesorhizobium sp.]